MKKPKQKVRSFKENLKRMLMLYSLVPVVQLLVLCIVIIMCVGSFFIISRNRRNNQDIAQVMERTLGAYEELLHELAETPDIIDSRTSLTKRQKIVRKLYTTSVSTGYEGSLYILDHDFNVCVSTKEDTPDNLKSQVGTRWKILDTLQAEPNSMAFYAMARGSDKELFLGKAVTDGARTEGYVIVSIPGREFSALLSASIQKNVIADRDSWVFATSGYTFVDEIGRLDKEIRNKTGFFTYNHGSYFSSVQPVWDGNLYIYTITDNTDLIGLLITVLFTGCFVLFVVFFATFSSAERMAVKSTSDITKINEAFQSVMDGNLDAYLDICSSTEFKHIGTCYNEMVNSLKWQIAANKELAETVAYAHVKQLESQFNSHFLFNTLDNIRFMCKIDADLAETMTISLSSLLRYNTSNANEKVPVEEDLKYIGIYLEIMKVRFMERLDFTVEVMEEVKDCLMPKLLIQPVIENSIKHGFGDREHLTVEVRVFRQADKLVLICRDDGVGIPPEYLEKLRHNLNQPENESAHLGLYNIHRRIRLMYGEEYGLQIENDKGTTITVCLPPEDGEREII